MEVKQDGIGCQDRVAFRGAATGEPPESDQQEEASQEYFAVDSKQLA